MSINPHFYSTMWGVQLFAGCFISALSLMALTHLALHRSGLIGSAVNQEHYHDLGKLIFAFTVFWAYVSYSQYFLIWYANIPEETLFFQSREGSAVLRQFGGAVLSPNKLKVSFEELTCKQVWGGHGGAGGTKRLRGSSAPPIRSSAAPPRRRWPRERGARRGPRIRLQGSYDFKEVMETEAEAHS